MRLFGCFTQLTPPLQIIFVFKFGSAVATLLKHFQVSFDEDASRDKAGRAALGVSTIEAEGGVGATAGDATGVFTAADLFAWRADAELLVPKESVPLRFKRLRPHPNAHKATEQASEECGRRRRMQTVAADADGWFEQWQQASLDTPSFVHIHVTPQLSQVSESALSFLSCRGSAVGW